MYHVVPRNTKTLDHYSLFLAAVACGHAHIIDLMLKKGYPVSSNPNNKPNSDTPLHVAIETEDFDIVGMLLQNGAPLEATSHDGQTPLHFAVKSKQKNLVTRLLEYGADWRAVDDRGKTMLHLAVEQGTRCWNGERSNNTGTREIIEILEMFLSKRMDVNGRTKNGETALHVAVRHGMKEVAAYLLLRGADIHACDDMDNGVIHMVIMAPNDKYLSEFEQRKKDIEKADLVEWLISKGARADVRNHDQKSPLQLAAEYGQMRIQSRLHIILCPDVFDRSLGCKRTELVVQLMVKMRAEGDINVDVNFNVGASAKGDKQTRIIYALLMNFEDVNDHDMLLHIAIDACIDKDIDYQDLTVSLIDKAANVKIKNVNNVAPLHLAAKYKYKQLLEYLLDHGIDVNLCSNDGYNALHFLCSEQNCTNIRDEANMVRLLVSKGCNVHARTKEGLTALHIASQSGSYSIVEALLQHGADVDCTVNNGITPLHFASMLGRHEVVETLLKHGADVNSAEDSDLSTPLHVAVQNEHHVAVNLLLRSGADISAKQRNLATAIDVADNCKDRNILRTLIFHAMKLRVVGFLPNMRFFERHDYVIAKVGVRQCIVSLKDYYKACVNEMKVMKKTMVTNRTSLYDVLHMDEHRLGVYKNQLVHVELEFPMFQDIILGCYRTGVVRGILADQARQVMMRNNKMVLPECCWEHVFSFLTSKDLRNVVGASRQVGK